MLAERMLLFVPDLARLGVPDTFAIQIRAAVDLPEDLSPLAVALLREAEPYLRLP